MPNATTSNTSSKTTAKNTTTNVALAVITALALSNQNTRGDIKWCYRETAMDVLNFTDVKRGIEQQESGTKSAVRMELNIS